MTILELFKKVHPSVLAAKMIFKHLQDNFPVLKISDIADTSSGGTPNRGMIEYYNGDIPWVKSGELKDGIITTCDEYITEAGLKNSSAKLFPKGTLLVAMYGANIGKTGVLDFDATTNQAVCAIFPKVEISKDFLFWYFKQQRIEFIAIGKGGAQPNISQTVINNASIVVPDPEIQKKIVEFLEAIEQGKGIDNNFFIPEVLEDVERIYKYKNSYIDLSDSFETQLTQLENLNQAILQEAVQGKLVKQDPKDEPASELLKRIKMNRGGFQPDPTNNIGLKPTDTAINRTGFKPRPIKALPPIKPEEIPFEIPENWVWCRLGDVVDNIVGGGTPSKMNASYWNGNVPWASVKDLKGKFLHDTIDKITEIAIKSSSTNLIPANNIIVCTRMGLGKICINKIDTAINQDLKAVFLNKNIEPEYFYNYYRTLKIIGSGMTVNGIKQEQLLNFHFPLPPLSEQKRIVVEIEKQFTKTKQLKEHIIANQHATEQLLKALLHQAFEVEEMEEV